MYKSSKAEVFSFTKKDINLVPFHLGLEAIPHISAHFSWIIPQALAKLNKDMKLVRNELGNISPTATLVAFRGSLGSEEEILWWKGLFDYLTLVPRGKEVLGSASQINNIEYSSLVPLALSAFKKFRGVTYDEWDFTDPQINVFVDKELLRSVYIPVDFSKEELLSFRDIASIIKTTNAVRSSNQMYQIYSVDDPIFDKLPNLTKVMLLQTWIAAPNLRNPLQILNPNDLDNIPEPLLSTQIVETSNKSSIKSAYAW